MGRRSKSRQPSNARKPNACETTTAAKTPASTIWAICGLLALAVLLVFGQTLSHGFVNIDDGTYVTQNRQVVHGWTGQGVAWSLTACRAGNWHPLTWLSHMADCQLYGVHAWGHHLTNVLLHAMNAVLLFLVLRRMTGSIWPSALTAALFAIHPLRAESVAWVSERKDLLGGLFFFLTLWAYVGYAQHRFSWRRYLTVVVLFALGLMSKPMLVTLPCVLLLLDYWPLGRVASGQWSVASDRSRDSNSASDAASCPSLATDHRPLTTLLLEKLPLFLLSAASCIVTPLAQGSAVAPLEMIPFGTRLANALVAYVGYLREFFVPTGLAVFYPYPAAGLPGWNVAAALLLLTSISVVVVVVRRRFPYWLVGWFWYLGMMVPVIGLVQVGSQAMADRYTYLPLVGVAMAVSWSVAQWVAARPRWRPTCEIAATLALLVLMGCAWRQTSYWRDSEMLWTRALACTTGNAFAHNNLGLALADRGQNDDALVQYQKALAVSPRLTVALGNFGAALAERGQFDEAVAQYQKALQVDPNYGEAYVGLGNVAADRNRWDEAIDLYRKAAALKPDLPEAHANLGAALAERGRWDEAVAEYGKALEISPGYVDAHYNLANAMAAQHQLDRAVDEYQKTLALKPDLAEARNNLGTALWQQRREAEAVAQWQAAIRLRPDLTGSLGQLAWARAASSDDSLRNGPEAVALAQRLVQSSDDPPAQWLDILAAALAESHRFSEAVAVEQRAVAAAQRQGNAENVPPMRERLRLYQAGKTYREPSQARGR
ncbi:MAG: tetratricopeptide repeat protein [Thermoguttaceae bacterium]